MLYAPTAMASSLAVLYFILFEGSVQLSSFFVYGFYLARCWFYFLSWVSKCTLGSCILNKQVIEPHLYPKQHRAAGFVYECAANSSFSVPSLDLFGLPLSPPPRGGARLLAVFARMPNT